MALERIVLNIIPAGEMPVFHCSQYENGRPVIIDLVSSDDDAFLVPEGATVELHCRKVDDNIVTLEPDEVDNNTVTFVSTEQLTACPGDNLCEVVLYADTDPVQTIATLNFILHVEPDPLEGGLTSETQIYNLTQQIEEITQQVIGDDYYNKTEVDDLLDDKADKSDTYTKTQVDNALAAKANSADLATVATTGDYDDLINKPTIPAAQVQSDYAQDDNTQVDYIKNKPDISGMIAAALLAVMPVGTESGPIVSFDTEIAAPLVNVSCDIVATGGNGTPDSPNPINGYSEANIVNTQNESIVDLFSIDSDFRGTVAFNQLVGYFAGNVATISNVGTNEYKATSTALRSYFGFNLKQTNSVNISTVVNNIYFVSLDITEVNVANITGIEISGGFYKGVGTTTGKRTYILKANTTNTLYINATTSATSTTDDNFTVKNVMLIDLTQMLGSTIADYIYSLEQNNAGAGVEFFRSIYPDDYYAYDSGTTEIVGKETPEATIAFGQTVYGGVLDVTRGKLKPCIYYPSYNGETLSGRWLSSEATYIEGTTPPTGSQVVSIDDYGSDIDLTPEVISAFVGTNNVYSDTNGDTTVQYKDSIQHYIDQRT